MPRGVVNRRVVSKDRQVGSSRSKGRRDRMADPSASTGHQDRFASKVESRASHAELNLSCKRPKARLPYRHERGSKGPEKDANVPQSRSSHEPPHHQDCKSTLPPSVSSINMNMLNQASATSNYGPAPTTKRDRRQ